MENEEFDLVDNEIDTVHSVVIENDVRLEVVMEIKS